jgi:hypothetical protein
MYRVLLALFYGTLTFAAQSWADLRSLDGIRVQDTAGKEYKGAFRNFSDTAISIDEGGRAVSVERQRVRRVQVKSTARRLHNMAIGAGIGLALGLIADHTLGAYLRNEYSEGDGARA